MSTALYRRYRPESFAEVIGQEHVTVPLCAAISKDRINHAYLFSGPRGCGKTTSARILARCLNCAQGPTATPCGVCASCVDLARGGSGSLDVVEIDAASHGGVDDARSLRERAAFAPARDRYKVFIIDEAHMVSTQGFNALLKIVEEPPPHVRFVFATTEPEKVIGTIRSRTHHYPFRLVPPERLQSYLAELCEAESVPVGQGVLPLVVRAGAGSVRDSLSVLDQLMAGAGDEGLTYALAVSLLGYTDAALLDEVADGLAAGDGRAVFGVIDRVISSGHDPRRFVEDLLERLRDLLVVAAVPDGGHGVLRGLPADQFERMKGQAARFGRAELSRAADVVNTALTEMTGATSPRLQLELLVARLLLPGSEETERGLRARVDRIEKRIGVVAPGTPLATPVTAAAVEPPTAPAAQAPVAAPTASSPRPAAQAPQRQSAPARESAPAARETAPVRETAPTREPGTSSREAAPVRPAAPPPAAAQRPAPAGGGVETVRRMWPDVLDKLRGMRRMTWTLVSEYAKVLDLEGDRLLLVFDSDGRAASFGRGSHAEYVRQCLIEVIGLDCRVEAVSGDAVRGRPPARPEPPAAPAAPAAPSGTGSGAAPAAAPAPGRPGGAARQTEPPGWGAPAAAPAAPVPPAAEPPGWEARPSGSAAAPPRAVGAPTTQRGPERPAEHSAPPPAQAAPAPAMQRSEQGRGGAGRPPAGGRSPGGARPQGGARRPPAPGDDDIPLPPEPPSDEPPPEDDFDPYSRPTGPLQARRPEAAAPVPATAAPVPATAAPVAPVGPAVAAAPAAAAPATGPAPVAAEAAAHPAADPAARPSRYAALRAAVPGAERPSGGPIVLPDDEPSADDVTLEESGLVGPSVVAQLLGGRVIEERDE